MKIESPAFSPMGEIPRKYTCEGQDTPPPLIFSHLPHEAKSLALIIDDPDAPDPKAPKMTWVHWVVFNIPTFAPGLPEGGTPLPAGTRQGLNDWKRASYGGPCPPIGRHRYFHKLYALDTELESRAPDQGRAGGGDGRPHPGRGRAGRHLRQAEEVARGYSSPLMCELRGRNSRCSRSVSPTLWRL